MTDIAAAEVTQTPSARQIKVPYALLTLLALLLIWQAATIVFQTPSYLLPSPFDIMIKVGKDWKLLLAHSGVTTFEIVIGFVISVVIGLPLAILVTYSPVFDKAIYPLIVGSQTIPKVALAPLMLAWLGFGYSPKILITALVAFFPIVINSVVGLRSAPPQMLHLARSMGSSPMQIFFRFRLPQALPNIFAGMKLAVVLAVIGAIVAEFVGADAGLGYLIIVAGSSFDIPRQFAAIVVLSAIGMAFFWLAAWVERKSLPWHVSIRATHS